VAIPAYNEAKSINALLESICSGHYDRHRLFEVLVCNDASTDATAEIIARRASRFPVIVPMSNRFRSGCANTVARLLDAAEGDVVVRVNADVAVEDGAIELLADAVDAGAAIAIGATMPIAERRTPAALASSFSFDVVARLKSGPHREHYAVSDFVAYRRDALKGLVIPRELINEDHYIAAHIVRAGGLVSYVPLARSRLKLPSTALDYWRHSRRVLEGERQLRRRYGVGSAPWRAVFAAVAQTALRRPIDGVVWAAMYAWSSCRISPAHDGSWPMSASTKGLIS